MIVVATAALLSSIFFPYWKLKVTAPQYPKGLKVTIFVNRLEGDVAEIDSLNHYIGMRPLKEGARIERELSIYGIAVLALCLIGAFFVRRSISIVLLLPVIFFPGVFAADLYLWLRDFGLHLNPHAALSSSVKPFVPPILGHGKIAQFHAYANFAFGHGLSMLAAILSSAVAVLRVSKRLSTRMGQAIVVFLMLLIPNLIAAQPASAKEIVVGELPYWTIQSALDIAQDGDTILVRPGAYLGPIEVKKSVKLIGQGRPSIDGEGQGTVVRLAAPDILFKGFDVKNSGDLLSAEHTGIVAGAPRAVIEDNRLENVLFGIYIHRAPGSQVKNNRMTGKSLDVARRGDLIRVWYSDDVVIEGNETRVGRDVVLWYSKNIRVIGNEFSHARYGLHFMYCRGAVVENNKLIGNSVGAYLMYSDDLKLSGNVILDNRGPSGYGLGFKDMKDTLIENNLIASNRVGFFLDGSSQGIVQGNQIAYNGIGFELFPTTNNNRFIGNNVIDNSEQVLMDGASVHTVNDWSGNYWSDYRGFDAAGDGTGDIPYKPMKLFERLADHAHGLKVFFMSPSVNAIDFAAATFPVFSPTPKFVDKRPLMSPLRVGVRAPMVITNPWMTFFSLALFLPLLGFFRMMPRPSTNGAPALTPMPGATEPFISVRGLFKRYKKVAALSNLDLEVRRGEALAIWGPNGAGKTTLLRSMLGIISFEGNIRISGLDVKKDGKKVRALIGYVPQEVRLHLDQTVLETVGFYAALRGVGKARVEFLIEEWGLSSSKKQYAQNLSGGMKQKLALIIALLSDPPVLFLDEPTSNLDQGTRQDFGLVLEKLKKSGKTLIFCSHRISEIQNVADRVIVLEAGIKKADGNPGVLG